MIKAIEKDFLNDKFINKSFVYNIKITDNLKFNKQDTYYFGNYDVDKINIIKTKIIKNKKSIINAVEKGVKFIICGNSIEIFNNSFKSNELNLFTFYSNNSILHKYDKKIKLINNLKQGIYSDNFKYKNLVCISKQKYINKIIKNQSNLQYI